MDETLLKQVAAVLATTAARFADLTRTIPQELLERQPQPGEWSALQTLQHLVDTEEWIFPVRVEAILAGQNFPGFNPDTQGRVDRIALAPTDLAARFGELRAHGQDMLARVGVADLDRTAVHGELGEVTMRELLNEWATHDLNHLVQAERAIMQPFIVGAGPWRHYFKDHDVSAA